MANLRRSGMMTWTVGAMLLGGCSQPIDDASAGRHAQPIIDGRAATTAELYATVAIVDPNTGDSFCTGTLVAPGVVVSAAHCFYGEGGQVMGAADMEVVAGALVALDATQDQIYPVAAATAHPGYDNAADPGELGQDDDIAVLVLDADVDGQNPAAVPAMADIDNVLGTGTSVIITGYGARDANAEDPNLAGELYIAETPFQQRSEFEYIAGATGSPDSCPGDSGGPGYVDVGGTLYLVGASSRSALAGGDACGDGGINTLVPAYTQWIADNSEGLYEAPTPGGTDSAVASGTGAGGGATPPATAAEDDGGCRAAPGGRTPASGWWLALALGLLAHRRRQS